MFVCYIFEFEFSKRYYARPISAAKEKYFFCQYFEADLKFFSRDDIGGIDVQCLEVDFECFQKSFSGENVSGDQRLEVGGRLSLAPMMGGLEGGWRVEESEGTSSGGGWT